MTETLATGDTCTSTIDALEQLRRNVARMVAARRRVDPEPDDPYRGLYISDDLAAQLAEPSTERADGVDSEWTLDGWPALLRRTFTLSDLDATILLVAFAPDADPRFERLYAYLQDDVTRRRPTIGLALELAGASPLDAIARTRFLPGTPLVDGALIEVVDTDRPFLSRTLRVPDTVASQLLGGDLLDTGAIQPNVHGPAVDSISSALRAGIDLVYVRDESEASRAAAVARTAGLRGERAVRVVEWGRHAEITIDEARRTVRDARMIDALLVCGPVDVLAADALDWLASARWPVVLFGRRSWDPNTDGRVPLIVETDEDTVIAEPNRSLVDVAAPALAALASFRLGPRALDRGLRAATVKAAAQGRLVDEHDVAAGAREQNSPELERLTTRVVPAATWEHLVLPPEARDGLAHIVTRVMCRGVVREWCRRGTPHGRGDNVTALFVGESGTGKTLAAEVLAGALGLDLYLIDLSAIVDKYIGETEKNLDRVFSEAQGVNGVLFFDEADALFGKRSEVSDARDRYANIEVAYLLQRMEHFDGLAILATNLHANLDEAFLRRLSVVVHFPKPDVDARRRLWSVCLDGIPRADDVDVEFCARAFDLTGGHIRNICVTAAFYAADEVRSVTMCDLIRATHDEYRKLGRLCVEAEFGPYLDITTT